MTVLIILEFENEEQAKVWTNNSINETFFKPYDLIGVFKKPEDYCKCVGSNRPQGWTQGKVYGFWVCPRCNKVSKMVMENFCKPAFNLLPNEILPEKDQHKNHSKYEWRFLVDDSRESEEITST